MYIHIGMLWMMVAGGLVPAVLLAVTEKVCDWHV